MPSIVEYHPDSKLPMLHAAGEFRVLGCLEPHARCSLPTLDAAPVVSDAYREVDLQACWPSVTTDDQGGSQACVGHGIRKQFSYSWLSAGGTPRDFSPTYVYGLINGGRDAGAVVSDGLTAVKMYGIAESSLVPEGMIFRQQFPSASYANARRFRAVEAYRCTNFDDICRALSSDFAVVSGIYVGKNFGDLSSDGVAPLPDKILGGHCLCHCGLKFNARINQWVVLTQNSWSQNWGIKHPVTGQGGFCYLTAEHWDHEYVDAWAIGGVCTDPEAEQLPVAH